MTIIVCGGRTFTNRTQVHAVLDAIHERTPITKIVHGAGRGADELAAGWARKRGVPEIGYAAEWRLYGLSAGRRRNTAMLVHGDPEMVIAFPGGPGTADMMRQARSHQVPVREIGALE